MKTLENYSIKIKVNATVEKVFNALNEDMDSWWGNISNSMFETNGQFTITFENGYWWTFKIIEFTPNSELVWKCIDGEPEFNKEWIGHVLHWQITEDNTEITINFHQTGLTPQLHCFEVCSTTWDMFITEKLKQYVETT